MLKKRIVGLLVVKDGIVVQSIGFRRYLPVGSVIVCAEFLNNWGIDEIVILDIDATIQKRKPDFDLVSKVSKKVFVPLTVGGGIGRLDDIKKLIHCGADRISINKKALIKPKFIEKAAKVFGNQCIVVSIDVGFNKDGNYEVFTDSGQIPAGINPVKLAKQVEESGAGEILLNSIERDGSKKGYDIELFRQITDCVSIPVIGCGGVGQPLHFLKGILKGNISAAVAGNFFHFTEHSPILVKAYLIKNGIDIMLDTYADYKNIDFDDLGRIKKRSEEYLEKLRFEYLPKEVI